MRGNGAVFSTNNPMKTGYLFKKGRGLSLALLKPWNYRWFALDLTTGIMRYYADENGFVISYFWNGMAND